MNSAPPSLFVLSFALAAASAFAQPADTEAATPATSQCDLDSLKPLPWGNPSAQQNVIAAIEQADSCLEQRDAACAETALTSVQTLAVNDDERALLAIPRAELAMQRADSAAAVEIYRETLALPEVNEALRRDMTRRLAFVLETRRDFAAALRTLASSGCDSWTADMWAVRAIAYQNLGARTFALESFEAALKLYELEDRAVPAAIHDRHQALLAAEAPEGVVGPDVVPLVRVNPDYPPRAMRGRISGWVLLEYDITDNGTVDNVRAVKSANEIFEPPAIAAVQRWRYAPKFENGLPAGRAGLETVLRFCLEPCDFRSNPPPELGPDGRFTTP